MKWVKRKYNKLIKGQKNMFEKIISKLSFIDIKLTSLAGCCIGFIIARWWMPNIWIPIAVGVLSLSKVYYSILFKKK